MAFKEECQVTTFTDQVAVIIVTAPAAGEVIVIRSIHVDNRDDVGFEARFHINKGGTKFGITAETIGAGPSLGVEVDIADNRIVLNATDQSLEGKMDVNKTTTDPTVVVHFARES